MINVRENVMEPIALWLHHMPHAFFSKPDFDFAWGLFPNNFFTGSNKNIDILRPSNIIIFYL